MATTKTTPALADPIGAELKQVLRTLKLGRMLDTLPERLTLARQRNLPHADFLELDLADEVTRRDTSSAALRARAAGLDPGRRLERAASTWADFLRSQADALLACDFLETVTLTGTRMYVFAAIEHASRRIRILGATAHPTASWVVQAAKNLVMDLEDTGCRARFMIRDRDGKSAQINNMLFLNAVV